MNHKDLKVENSTYLISLKKLIGKEIKDIHGYLTSEFGEPVFKACYLVFEDDTDLGFEGEHDLPYLVDGYKGSQPNYDMETLERLYEEGKNE